MFNILVKIAEQDLSIRKQGNVYHIYDSYNKKLSFTTPIVNIPFGLEKYQKKYYINMEFTNVKTNNYIYNFMATIQTIDNYFRNLQSINNIDLTKLKYYSCFKERPEQYDPMLRTMVKCNVEIESDYPNTIFDIEKGTFINCIIEIDNLWIYDDTYGLQWVIKKIFF